MREKTELQSLQLLNHSKCMLAAFQNFRQDETMLDVTLACEGMTLKAHKIVLSACSPFFKKMFADNPCKHPIVIMKDFEFVDLKAIIDFIYKGELSVSRERLESILKVAKELQVRGLKSDESNRENYEKLYNQLFRRQHRKKRRKKHIENSSESEQKEYSSDDTSDNINFQSEESSDDNVTETFITGSSHTDVIDEEKAELNHSSDDAKESRPVVLRVGETNMSVDESPPQNDLNAAEDKTITEEPCLSDESDNHSSNEVADEQDTENHLPDESAVSPEQNAVLSSTFDSYVTCPESADKSMLPAEQENTEGDINSSVPESEIPGCSKDEPGQSVTSSHVESTSSVTVKSANMTTSQPEVKAKIIGKTTGYECHLCGRLFTSYTLLRRHEVIMHKATDTKLPFRCHYCPFTAKNLRDVKDHMLSHSKERPYKYAVCSKAFKVQRHLQQHLSLHSKKKLYACDQCPSKFKRSSSLAFHSAVHQRELPFVCRYCCKKFFVRYDFLKHEITCRDSSRQKVEDI